MHRQCGFQRTVLLHDVQETDDDLGGGADQDLALASLLGVVDGVKRIVQDGGLHFGGSVERRFSSGGAASGIYTRDVLAFKSLPERKECPSGSHEGYGAQRVLQLDHPRRSGVMAGCDRQT